MCSSGGIFRLNSGHGQGEEATTQTQSASVFTQTQFHWFLLLKDDHIIIAVESWLFKGV